MKYQTSFTYIDKYKRKNVNLNLFNVYIKFSIRWKYSVRSSFSAGPITDNNYKGQSHEIQEYSYFLS